MTPYDHLSNDQLIEALVDHDATLSEIYATIHLPNTVMAPGEKLFWIAARSVLAAEKPREDGLVRLPTGVISAFNGMSDGSNNRYSNALIERFGAKKESVPYRTKKGQERELTYIDRSDPVWREPWTVDLPEEKARVINGNGKYCEHCQTYNLQVRTQRLTYQEIQVCECCGYKKVSDVLTDHAPLEPGEYSPPKKGLQAEEPFPEIAVSEPEPEAEAEKAQKSESLPIPSTPPLGVDLLELLEEDVPPKKALQPEDLLGDQELHAAQLLLAIAGEHSSHIQMCKDGESKYITVHSSLDLGDMRTHLRGYKTKGVVDRPLDGQTRALWFEGDTPEHWQRCKEAAQLLAASDDFKPLLSPSPTMGKHQGGGHLWIIFDQLVDAYSALKTVYQYTGHLLQDLEHWPGGGRNARLPGGKYLYKCAAWCHLEDEQGQNGIGSAAMLLTRLTPAAVVNEYPKPDPVNIVDNVNEVERTKPSTPAGGYLEKDLARQVVVDFNASHTWSEMLGLPDRQHKYAAIWRNDRTPNVAIDPRTDLAKDFSTEAWIQKPMDQYQVYCLIQGGQDWEAFKRRDLAQRCAALRDVQEPDEEAEEEKKPASRTCKACGVLADGYIDGRWLCTPHYKEVQRYQDARRTVGLR